ncbi:FHA domain-containing protein [Nocardioides sp. zg-1308]|uniref:FHA domain-containing protein n=1 Tax=Nocardioides sp. zg-1308 TaxID=2736253 RepID=UPI001551DB99|nr:FHA domain-containing protein [Nocardioides sp. zg-1308]NPD06533.1 FHA domain-containing protein [Nocardioides sp. zg-1308]
MRTPTVIVDVSTVVRDDDDPGWHRMDALIALWRQEMDERAVFYGVLDHKSWYLLDDADQASFAAWQAAGRGTRAAWADPLVCEMAEKHPHAKVLTRDLYRDLRRDFVWLQNSDRFYSFDFSANGVSLRRSEMGHVRDEDVSQYGEAAALKPRNLGTPEGRQMLRREWACSNPRCPSSAASAIDTLPYNKFGKAVCPECRQPLHDVGEAAQTRELKLLIEGNDVAHLPLVEGARLTFGRSGGEDRFDLRPLVASNQTLISREHVAFRNQGGRILVSDLGSKNGTSLVREDGRKDPIPAGVEQRMELHEFVSIAGGVVEFRLSGKRYARGAYIPDRGAAAPAGATLVAPPPTPA